MAKITTQLFGDLAFLPFQAEVPITEVIEFMTDVIVSHNGLEQNVKLRANPRHRVRYSIPEQPKNKQRSFNTQYAALTKQWAVPMWSEPQYIGAVVSGNLSISCVTDNYDYRNNSLAFLYESDTKFQVLEIDTVSSGILNLLNTTDEFSNAWLMPMRRAFIDNGINKRTNGYNGSSEINYEIEDLITLPETVPTQFQGNDIYFDVVLTDDGYRQLSIESKLDIHDQELGLISRRAPWTHNRIGKSNHFILTSAQEMRSFKSWLMRRCGKLRPFWQPSFESDIRLKSTGTITNTIVAYLDDMQDWQSIIRPHIAIQLRDGSWLTRSVTVILAGADATLTLDSNLNINSSLIEKICFLGLHRLDSDSIEINWIGNCVAKSSIRTIELLP